MSLPICQAQQVPSAQYHQQLMGVTGDVLCVPGDNYSICLTSVQFHPQKVTPVTNPAKVMVQRLSLCSYDAWGWYNSHQIRVIRIADQFILQNGKKLRGV